MQKQKKVVRQKMHVRKGDTVQVIAGKDKGVIGEIVAISAKKSQVIVQGANMRTKHVKPQAEGETGQILTKEFPIHSSNVMLYSKKQKVASRVAQTLTEDGRKVRMLKKTGEILD
ncbi:MAG: 50S ribosomal protein L24 [Phormidesmis sp.]